MPPRKSKPPKSPLDGKQYDYYRGDYDLDDVTLLPLDDLILALARDFPKRSTSERELFRDSTTYDDNYTLLFFGKRAAAFAMKTGNNEWLHAGLTSIAMIDASKVDPRDRSGATELIDALMRESNLDSTNHLLNAARLADPEMSNYLQHVSKRPLEHRQLSSSMYAIVTMSDGPKLIRRDINRYSPTLPIDQAILRISRELRSDEYTAKPEIASMLSKNHLSGVDDSALSVAMFDVVAVATVSGEWRSRRPTDRFVHGLSVYLLETNEPRSAINLLRIADAKQLQSSDVAMMATQNNRLFCLFVAQNFMKEGKCRETTDSLQRFLPATEKIIADCLNGDSP